MSWHGSQVHEDSVLHQLSVISYLLFGCHRQRQIGARKLEPLSSTYMQMVLCLDVYVFGSRPILALFLDNLNT